MTRIHLLFWICRMNWTLQTRTGRPCLLCLLRRNGRSIAARKRYDFRSIVWFTSDNSNTVVLINSQIIFVIRQRTVEPPSPIALIFYSADFISVSLWQAVQDITVSLITVPELWWPVKALPDLALSKRTWLFSPLCSVNVRPFDRTNRNWCVYELFNNSGSAWIVKPVQRGSAARTHCSIFKNLVRRAVSEARVGLLCGLEQERLACHVYVFWNQVICSKSSVSSRPLKNGQVPSLWVRIEGMKKKKRQTRTRQICLWGKIQEWKQKAYSRWLQWRKIMAGLI